MNRITKSWMSRGAFMMLAIAGLLFATVNANASCGDLMGMGSKSPIKLPMLAGGAHDDLSSFPGFNDSIVGLWHVVYTTETPNGPVKFNETFDTWHADGTEFENAYLPPDVGNVCYGVWKLISPRTVRLFHIGWMFTPGSTPPTATGTFTLDETNIVARDGKTYTGTFTFKTFDNNGVQGAEVMGTIAATRITVN